MINIKDFIKPQTYQDCNNVIFDEDGFWSILDKIEPVCASCGFKKQVIVNDFADLLNYHDVERHVYKCAHGTFVIGFGYKFMTNQNLIVFVNKTENRTVLRRMGTHVIVECPNCKSNYTP
jgi:hypothetical protein